MGNNELYNVIFSGEILPGNDLEKVKEGVGRVFGVSGNKLDMMFSGKTITIKKSADRATADKYLQAMKKAGALATAKAMESDAPVAAEKPAAASTNKTLASTTPSFTLGETGELLVPPAEVKEATFNTEGMTIAPVGSDVADLAPPPPDFEADLSDLTMAEAGEQILDANAPPAQTRGAIFKVDQE